MDTLYIQRELMNVSSGVGYVYKLVQLFIYSKFFFRGIR